MILWKLVVHGGVDVFSHCVVYSKSFNNNSADTVLSAFSESLLTFNIIYEIV